MKFCSSTPHGIHIHRARRGGVEPLSPVKTVETLSNESDLERDKNCYCRSTQPVETGSSTVSGVSPSLGHQVQHCTA